MKTQQHPEFRLGNVLATSFTATLSERHGRSVERIPVPSRLIDWLAIHGLEVDSCSAEELKHAQVLREAIHAVATAAAKGHEPPASDAEIINKCSVQGEASAILTSDGARHWRLRTSSVADALSVIAADAIEVVSGERDGKVAICASETCQAAFFDTSRSRTRRWCDMNSCGNREKKARFLANKREKTGTSTT